MKGTFQHHLRFTCIAVFLLSFAFGQVAAQETPPLDFEWQHFENAKMLDGDPWSPDNRYLAVGSLEGDAVLLLNRETWEVVERLELPATEHEVSTLQWSPNGDYIAVATYDELITLNVRDGNNFQATYLLSVLDGLLTQTRWMGDTDMLAVLDNSGAIYIIDAAAQKIVQSIFLDLYPSGEFLYSAFDWNSQAGLFAAPLYYTHTIGFWDASGNLVNGLVQQRTADAYRFASQCGAWSAEAFPPDFDFYGIEGNKRLSEIRWSNDGTQLAVVGEYNLAVCTLDQQQNTFTRLRQLHIPNPAYYPDNDEIGLSPYKMPNDVSWSPDDRWLLASQFYIPGITEDFCGVAVFDATEDFAYMGKIGEEFCQVSSMSWTSDGQQLVVGNGSDGYWVGTLQGE